MEETIDGARWDGGYSMMQWLYVRTKEDMNCENLIASEQIKNDVNSEKEILEAYDKWDCGDFCWLGFFFFLGFFFLI